MNDELVFGLASVRPSLVRGIGGLALALAGCTNTAAPPTPAAKPEPVASVPAPTDDVQATAPDPPAPEPPKLDLGGDPEQVGRALAQRWCVEGGEEFRPPTAGEDDERMELEACSDIAVYVEDQTRHEGTVATVLTLDAIWETRELLLLQSPDGAFTFDLAHTIADQSGEVDEPTHTYESPELRDVYGGPGVEWISTLYEHGGDSFEADRCHSHVGEGRSLYVCSAEAAKCFAVTYMDLETSEPRAADQLYDCGMTREELEPKEVVGFEQTIDVRRGEVEFTARRGTKIHERRSARREGVVDMAVLFREEALFADDEVD